jgi:hypothetical protein
MMINSHMPLHVASITSGGHKVDLENVNIFYKSGQFCSHKLLLYIAWIIL